MKTCPACQTQYTDDTLQFCLQDGTRLMFAREADTPTVVLKEPAWQLSQATHVAATQPKKAGSKMAIVVAATVLVMLVLFGAAGVGAWLYFRNPQTEIVKNTAHIANIPTLNPPASTVLPLTPKLSPSATPFATSGTVNPRSAGDDAQIKDEISRKIYDWKTLTESKNMSGLRSVYAPTLNFYYTKRNVSLINVIADKERAFSKYNSIRINLSVKSVTSDVSGDIATAIFEKDWTFEGIKPFCGRIRSEMQLRRINGVWLIVGERDVPGTFRRTC